MNPLCVIVTRPQAQAQPWVEALQAAGFAAQALPLLDIEPAQDPAAVEQAWHRLAGSALVMFVSANAVQHFFALKPPGLAWPLSALAGSTGPGTTAALQQAGMPAACIVEPLPGANFDSEALWARLRARRWQGQRVVLVRGEEGRDWLADQLREAGAQVEAVAAYRRLAPQLDAPGRALLEAALRDPAAYCWLFSSSEAIGHLQDLAREVTAEWVREKALEKTSLAVPEASLVTAAALLPESASAPPPKPTAQAAPAGPNWRIARALASHLRIAQTARDAGFGDVRLVDPRPQAVAEAVAKIQTHSYSFLRLAPLKDD